MTTITAGKDVREITGIEEVVEEMGTEEGVEAEETDVEAAETDVEAAEMDVGAEEVEEVVAVIVAMTIAASTLADLTTSLSHLTEGRMEGLTEME